MVLKISYIYLLALYEDMYTSESKDFIYYANDFYILNRSIFFCFCEFKHQILNWQRLRYNGMFVWIIRPVSQFEQYIARIIHSLNIRTQKETGMVYLIESFVASQSLNTSFNG